MNDFQQEWVVIHGDIERYERYSLGIKLFSVLVCLFAISGLTDGLFIGALILILWLQDGIWKTFQQRLERRIAFVEKRIVEQNVEQTPTPTSNEGNSAFQLYTQWEKSRQGAAGLIKEYALNSLKPTVAYPYILLVLLVLVFF